MVCPGNKIGAVEINKCLSVYFVSLNVHNVQRECKQMCCFHEKLKFIAAIRFSFLSFHSKFYWSMESKQFYVALMNGLVFTNVIRRKLCFHLCRKYITTATKFIRFLKWIKTASEATRKLHLKRASFFTFYRCQLNPIYFGVCYYS